MKLQITILQSAEGTRVISDRNNVESVNHPDQSTFEVEGEVIELRELGLNPGKKRSEEAPGEGGSGSGDGAP